MRTVMIGWALSVGLAGCGGGAGEAADECHALFDLTCERLVECGVPGATSVDACRDMLDNEADCDDADQVGAGYDSCMATMDTIACADLYDGITINLPPDCMSVILFE